METDLKKYYVPDISEFHVGFGFEKRNGDIALDDRGDTYTMYSDNWEKVVFDENQYYLIRPKHWHLSYKEHIRVKYLDRDCIESLGWEFNFKNNPSEMFRHNMAFSKPLGDKSKYILWFNETNNNVEIKYTSKMQNEWENKSFWELFFRGTIKNKSELKQIMKMLGI